MFTYATMLTRSLLISLDNRDKHGLSQQICNDVIPETVEGSMLPVQTRSLIFLIRLKKHEYKYCNVF